MLGQSKCHQKTIIVPGIDGTLQLGPLFTVDFGGVPFSVGRRKEDFGLSTNSSVDLSHQT